MVLHCGYITHDVVVNPNYTEHVLDGYTYTIYNSKLEEVGTVTDKILSASTRYVCRRFKFRLR